MLTGENKAAYEEKLKAAPAPTTKPAPAPSGDERRRAIMLKLADRSTPDAGREGLRRELRAVLNELATPEEKQAKSDATLDQRRAAYDVRPPKNVPKDQQTEYATDWADWERPLFDLADTHGLTGSTVAPCATHARPGRRRDGTARHRRAGNGALRPAPRPEGRARGPAEALAPGRGRRRGVNTILCGLARTRMYATAPPDRPLAHRRSAGARRGVRLDSRAATPHEVPMRLIGFGNGKKPRKRTGGTRWNPDCR
jgi:hypothetical protein